MKHMGLHLVDMLRWLAAQKAHPLTIVECGTIRDPRFDGPEDGLSTYHIAAWIKESEMPHKFYSFELSAGTLQASREFLAAAGLDQFVTYGLGDAGALLEHFNQPLDFAYLDAGADVHQNLEQFRRVQKWMREPGICVVDDVYDPRNANRGLLTVPVAELAGLKTCKIADRMAGIAFGEARKYRAEDVRWQ